MFDHYGAAVRHACWTWLEHKACNFIRPPRSKDRRITRMLKRSARQRAKKEAAAE
jgi:hypothetical protein